MSPDPTAMNQGGTDPRRATASDETPEIRVNGIAIPRTAIRQEAQNHPSPTPETALAAAARALVVRELLLQEARRQHLTPQPQCDDSGRVQLEEDALIDALLDREVVTPLADEAACRRYFDNNPAKLRSHDLYEVRHILIAAAAEDTAEREAAKTLATQVIEILQLHPARFGELAQAHSACPSREHGGNLGQITRGQTVPEFETFLFNLEEGQLCPVPVPTRFGYHVIQLDRKVAGRQLDFAIVQPKIAAFLEASSWSRAVAQYVSLLAGAARIEGIDLGGAGSPLVQ